MSDNITTLIAALIGVVGTVVVALVGMKQSRSTAEAAIQQAREAAGGPVYESTTARNAAFQMHRRQLYGDAWQGIVEYALNRDTNEIPKKKLEADLLKGVRKAQIVAHDPLREKLNKLAANPDSFETEEFNDLARAMNKDARVDG